MGDASAKVHAAEEENAALGRAKKEHLRVSKGDGGLGIYAGRVEGKQGNRWPMPVLKYLADTNALSDSWKPGNPVEAWFSSHPGEIGISALSLAEMRRGIELRDTGKARHELERIYRFITEDYREAIFVFDESAAMEWGRLMAEARNNPLPYGDSLIAAVARSCCLKVLSRNVKHFPGCITIDPWTGIEHPAWQPRSRRS